MKYFSGVYKLLLGTFGEVDFSSGLLIDLITNETTYFYKKEYHYKKSGLIDYMNLLGDNVIVILYYNKTNTTYIYDEKWTKYEEPCFETFQYFNYFIKESDGDSGIDSPSGKMVKLIYLLNNLGIDTTRKVKSIYISYYDKMVFFYLREFKKKFDSFDELNEIYIKYDEIANMKKSLKIDIED